MGNQGGEEQLFNVTLAKIIGLYQILDPGTVRCRSHNVLHVTVTFFMLFLGFMSMVIDANGVYYWKNVHASSLVYLVGSMILYFECYKMYVVVRHSGRIWDCLSVARFDFTKHERCDGGRLLDVWRNRSVRVTYAYSSIGIIILLCFMLCPVAFNDTTVEFQNRNGSSSNYRINILNLHLLASFDDTKYNRHFGVFFFFEGLITAIGITFNIITSTVLITLTFAFLCQLRMVSTAFEYLGHKTTSRRRPSDNAKSEKKLTVELDVYNDLITIIMDHQTVMQKIDVFFNMFGRPMFVQIFISSINLIISWFTIIVNFTNGDIAEMRTVLILQLFFVLPLFLFQIFIPCYLIGRIHDQKDCVIFSLYSSNWTEMNLKCKKLILLTMMMNNSSKKLKFTSRNIVNMEMFCRTLRICYTSLSMLLNYKKFKHNNN